MLEGEKGKTVKSHLPRALFFPLSLNEGSAGRRKNEISRKWKIQWAGMCSKKMVTRIHMIFKENDLRVMRKLKESRLGYLWQSEEI